MRRLQAAKRHLGIALVVDRVAQKLLSTGDLVHVLPNTVGRQNHARLVYPEREFVDPKVRAFVDFIASRVTAARTSTAPS